MKIEFPDKHTIESLVPKDFKFSLRLDVRWEDVDMYQHINNAKYYSFFDTTVNTNLVNQGLLDPEEGGAVFLCSGKPMPVSGSHSVPIANRSRAAHGKSWAFQYHIWVGRFRGEPNFFLQLLLTTHMCMSTGKQTDQRKYLHNCGNTLNH